jgi:colanic acid biosynthesis protein WcaH
MTDRVEWIPEDVWADVVRYAPVPSVDLVVRCPGGVLLARRQNDPAKGEWFVPGGRIQKGERLTEAVGRVAREELGVDVSIEAELGAYDHLYSTADTPTAGGKHYVAHGFVVRPETTEFELDDQHDEVKVFPLDDLPNLHEYVRMYLRDAGVTG